MRRSRADTAPREGVLARTVAPTLGSGALSDPVDRALDLAEAQARPDDDAAALSGLGRRIRRRARDIVPVGPEHTDMADRLEGLSRAVSGELRAGARAIAATRRRVWLRVAAGWVRLLFGRAVLGAVLLLLLVAAVYGLVVVIGWFGGGRT